MRAFWQTEFAAYSGLQAKNSNWADGDWQNVRAEAIGRIWEFLDHMRAGSFIVRPSQGPVTCKFCDFGAVCRYQKYRIERKKRSEEDG